MDIAFLTIAELNRLYDRRELSPVEVTKALLDRIAAHDGKLHSFLLVTEEVALAEARAAERELMAGTRRGPLQKTGNVILLQSELPCVPCSRAGCENHRQSRSDCLVDIGPERVMAEARRVLS